MTRVCLSFGLILAVGVAIGCSPSTPPDEQVEKLQPWEERGQQLQKVVKAISEHYDKNNRFPSYIASDQPFYARPHLSWRVYILPQLGHEDLFQQFNTDEPWDSEQNIKLLDKMPKIYLTPDLAAVEDREPGTTTVQALSGDGSILGSEKSGMPPSRKGIYDGLTETALVVECNPAKAVPWTKPDDFEFDPLEDKNDVERFGIDGEDFFLIVTVSGDLHRIRKDAEIKEIDRLLQRDDKRETAWAKLEYSEKQAGDEQGSADGTGDDGSGDANAGAAAENAGG